MMEIGALKNGIVFGGGILGFVVGAGFASGQEVLQFYTHLGFVGSIAAGLVGLILVAWFSMTIMEAGRRLQLEDPNSIFEYYCGKWIALFFEWFVPILMFLVASMMISAAGATLAQYFKVDPNVGRIIMTVITLVTVLLGLRSLVHIIGYMAPVIVLFTIAIGIIGIAENPAGVAKTAEEVQSLGISGPFSNWAVTGLMYAAYLVVGLFPYIAGIGKQARSKSETVFGGLFAGVFFLGGVMILGAALLANLGAVYDEEIPALTLVAQDYPVIASVFTIFLILAIYTTAVPMLWTAVNKLAVDEKSRKYKIVTIVLAILAFFGGHLQFSTMVSVVYPAIGYLGVILFVCMIYTAYIKKRPYDDFEESNRSGTLS